MTKQLQWYDSPWLEKYLAAKDIIAAVAPSKLPDFVGSFDKLRTDPTFAPKDLPRFFDAEALAHIRDTIKSIPVRQMELQEIKRFGRFVVHNYPVFSELQKSLVGQVSELAGEALEPRYNFLSLYTQMGVCEPHLDAPSVKWTLDVCIDQSEPWPIYFSQTVPWPETGVPLGDDWKQAIKADPSLNFAPKTLLPGDAVLFSGSNQWHYRDALPGKQPGRFCNLLFFHFIPKGMSELVRPRNWARLFGIPELAQIPGLDEQNSRWSAAPLGQA